MHEHFVLDAQHHFCQQELPLHDKFNQKWDNVPFHISPTPAQADEYTLQQKVYPYKTNGWQQRCIACLYHAELHKFLYALFLSENTRSFPRHYRLYKQDYRLLFFQK